MKPEDWGEEEMNESEAENFSRPGDEPSVAETEEEPPAPEPQAPPRGAETGQGGGGGAPGGSFREPEAAIEHGYDVDIGGNLSKAWNLLSANIGVFIGLGVIVLVFEFIVMLLYKGGGAGTALGQLLSWCAGPFIVAGVFIVTARAIMGNKPDIAEFFKAGRYFLPMFLFYIVSSILIGVGYLILIIPGIYLGVSWCLGPMLVVDRDLDFWTAMETSRRIVGRNWWSMFGALIVYGLIAAAGFIVFGVGALVTVPLAAIALILLYESVIGFKKTDF